MMVGRQKEQRPDKETDEIELNRVYFSRYRLERDFHRAEKDGRKNDAGKTFFHASGIPLLPALEKTAHKRTTQKNTDWLPYVTPIG